MTSVHSLIKKINPMKKLLLFSAFLLLKTAVIAGCGGPFLYAFRAGIQIGSVNCYDYTYPLDQNFDTSHVTLSPTDTFSLYLDVDNTCGDMTNVKWYKNGTLLYDASGPAGSSAMHYSLGAEGPGVYAAVFVYGGWPVTLTIYIPEATGITEAAAAPDFSIYPNPSHGLFTIDNLHNSGSCNVIIYDLSGHLLQQVKSSDSSISIDLSNCSPGLYLVEYVNAEGQRRMKKLIVD